MIVIISDTEMNIDLLTDRFKIKSGDNSPDFLFYKSYILSDKHTYLQIKINLVLGICWL